MRVARIKPTFTIAVTELVTMVLRPESLRLAVDVIAQSGVERQSRHVDASQPLHPHVLGTTAGERRRTMPGDSRSALRPRYGMLMPAVVATLTALAAFSPARATARSDTEGLLRIVSPTQSQGVFSGGASVELIVRRGAHLRVLVDRRNVTGALNLHRVRRRTNHLTVRGWLPQRLLRGGSQAVVFTASARDGRRSDSDSVLIQRVKRDRNFMSLRLKLGGSRSPADAIVRTRTHRIWLRVILNGRRIDRVSVSHRIGVRELRLTRTGGLRPGRNVLTVRANNSRGIGDIERRVFTISRRAVIPGVRALRQVRVGVPIRLDAGPTFAPRSAGRLAYRWSFVSRPRDSHAKIRGATRRVASFLPDRPGHYSVRLLASPNGRKGAAVTSAVRAGTLVTDVSAQTPISPYGLELQTDPSKGLTVGGSTTPMPPGSGGVLVAVVDSQTGAITRTAQLPGGGGAYDLDLLFPLLGHLQDPSSIVVVIGSGASVNFEWTNSSHAVELILALAKFGLNSESAQDLADAMIGGSRFALVGAPGSVPGAGTINTSSGPDAGVLDGRLRLTGITTGLTGTLVFAQPDYRLFKFGVDSPTMVTGVDPKPGTTPSIPLDASLNSFNPAASMSLTVLDATTLQPVVSDHASYAVDDPGIERISTDLAKYATDDTKLILFKMDAPIAFASNNGYANALSLISKTLAKLGANRDIFLRSLNFQSNGDGTGINNPGSRYVFFGGDGVEPVEGSSLITAQSASGGSVPVSSPTLSGFLRRNNRGQWAPAAAPANDTLSTSLQALAAQTPVPYGYPTNVAPGTQAQYTAAEGKLFQLIVNAGALCQPGPGCAEPVGVRVNYSNEELLENLSQAQNALLCSNGTTTGTLKPDSGAAYTQAQLNALQAEVCTELSELALVHDHLFEPLQNKVYTTLESDSTLDLLSASDTYLGFLKDKQDEALANKTDILGITGEAGTILTDVASASIEVASFITAPESGGTSEFIGQAAISGMSLVSDSISLASSVEGAGESPDKVAPTLVTVGNLFTYIQASYGYAAARLNETEGLITSDPTKLAAAAAQVKNGNWDLEQPVNNGHQITDVILFQQRVAALQYMLPRMISVDATPCDTGGSASDPTTYLAWTQLKVDAHGGPYLFPGIHRLRSAHLTKTDAQALGPHLFGAPFSAGTDPLAIGPTAAALPVSPFFMVQVAPTTQSKSSDCTDNISQ
jgi:hypothetical protein